MKPYQRFTLEADFTPLKDLVEKNLPIRSMRSGGRNTKEILIKGEPTKNAALARLSMEFETYRKSRGVGVWRWLIPPETIQRNGKWNAYARMVAEGRN